MKIQKKIVIITILTTSLLLGLLINPCKAANETSNQNANTQTTKQNTTTNTANTTNKTTTGKSNNANLNNLGVRPYDFTGFRYGTTSYQVEVPESTESVEVYAEVQDAKATLTGTGKKTLEIGENKAQVIVTAENGTKKTYTITIIRKGEKEEKSEKEDATEQKQEPVEEKKDNSKGLQELKIDNLHLSPEFQTDVYEYKVKYIGEATKLNIQTKATNEDYVIEVTGNDNLQEGENIITILVSEKNGENVATYQIAVDKSLVDEEAIAKQKEEEEKAKQQKITIGIIIGVVVVIAIVVIFRKRRKKMKKIEEDFYANPYYEDYDSYDDEYQKTPKAFRHGNDYQETLTENKTYDNFGTMPKEEAKEEFLKGYTSQYDIDFGGRYQEDKTRGKHKGKRFK